MGNKTRSTKITLKPFHLQFRQKPNRSNCRQQNPSCQSEERLSRSVGDFKRRRACPALFTKISLVKLLLFLKQTKRPYFLITVKALKRFLVERKISLYQAHCRMYDISSVRCCLDLGIQLKEIHSFSSNHEKNFQMCCLMFQIMQEESVHAYACFRKDAYFCIGL